MGNLTSDPTITNCVLWGNSAYEGDEIYNSASSNPSFSFCDIKDCNGSGVDWDSSLGIDDGNNIDDDPCFADVNNPAGWDGIFRTFDDGVRIIVNSPCIDAADGYVILSTDIVGLGRVDIGSVDNTGAGDPNYADIGSYESYSGYGSDSDGDGLYDFEENLLGTNPNDSDSDDDGLSDGDEFNVHHTNPLSTDSDGDELSDYDEINSYYTNPTVSDTDSDGMDDGWEVTYGLEPLDDDDADGETLTATAERTWPSTRPGPIRLYIL